MVRLLLVGLVVGIRVAFAECETGVPDGAYFFEPARAPFRGAEDVAPATDVLIILNGAASIDGVTGPTRARFRRNRRGDFVAKLRWPARGNVAGVGTVRMNLGVQADCEQAFGTVTAPRRGVRKVAFVAAPSFCGDGILDSAPPIESCDRTAGGVGTGCQIPTYVCTNACICCDLDFFDGVDGGCY